jgi:hypothetical protein
MKKGRAVSCTSIAAFSNAIKLIIFVHTQNTSVERNPTVDMKKKRFVTPSLFFCATVLTLRLRSAPVLRRAKVEDSGPEHEL